MTKNITSKVSMPLAILFSALFFVGVFAGCNGESFTFVPTSPPYPPPCIDCTCTPPPHIPPGFPITITFDSLGGSYVAPVRTEVWFVPDSSQFSGFRPFHLVSRPNNPVKNGYRFMGWYVDYGTWQQRWYLLGGDRIEGHTLLYARWEAFTPIESIPFYARGAFAYPLQGNTYFFRYEDYVANRSNNYQIVVYGHDMYCANWSFSHSLSLITSAESLQQMHQLSWHWVDWPALANFTPEVRILENFIDPYSLLQVYNKDFFENNALILYCWIVQGSYFSFIDYLTVQNEALIISISYYDTAGGIPMNAYGGLLIEVCREYLMGVNNLELSIVRKFEPRLHAPGFWDIPHYLDPHLTILRE